MELNKATFDIQDLKQLLKEAFEFDCEKHKREVKFYPFTIVEWYKSNILKKQLISNNSKDKILERYKPFQAVGIYFRTQKSLAVFFQRSEINSLLEYTRFTLEELILYYIVAVFHELEHHYQYVSRYETRKSSKISFFDFIYDIEYFVFGNNTQHYHEHHDEYWLEIGANLYSVERACDFLRSKGLITKKIEKNLRKYKNKYLFASNNYDIHYFLHELHKIVKDSSKVDINNYWYLRLLYENNGQFNSIDDIIYCADKLGIDEEVLKYFFSSKDFLESLDFNSLSKENKKVIMNAIEYALETEINRRKKNREFLQNRQISSEIYLSYDARICSKIAYLNKKLEEFKRLMEIPIMNCNLDEETQDKRR